MSRDYRLYLDDIIEAIRRIDAVVRNLEIIGEASGRLPEAVRQAAAEIEWRKVVGIRNILAHGYSVSVCRLSGMWFKTSWTSCPMHVRVLYRNPSTKTQGNKSYHKILNLPETAFRLSIMVLPSKLSQSM